MSKPHLGDVFWVVGIGLGFAVDFCQVGEGSFGAAILCQHDSEKERDTKADGRCRRMAGNTPATWSKQAK